MYVLQRVQLIRKVLECKRQNQSSTYSSMQICFENLHLFLEASGIIWVIPNDSLVLLFQYASPHLVLLWVCIYEAQNRFHSHIVPGMPLGTTACVSHGCPNFSTQKKKKKKHGYGKLVVVKMMGKKMFLDRLEHLSFILFWFQFWTLLLITLLDLGLYSKDHLMVMDVLYYPWLLWNSYMLNNIWKIYA